MNQRYRSLSQSEQTMVDVAKAFLHGRLEERTTLDWALSLAPGDRVKRLALLQLLDDPREPEIREPWRSLWRLVEEMWEGPEVYGYLMTSEYHARKRLRNGDRSGALISAIVEWVAARPTVTLPSKDAGGAERRRQTAKSIEDLCLVSLTSNERVDLSVLDLGTENDKTFLHSLAQALDSAVSKAISAIVRSGWNGKGHPWRLGQLYRVYHVLTVDLDGDGDDPDRHNAGIAPSVKLLYTVVSRLVEVDTRTALGFVKRWETQDPTIYLRLTAALYRDSRVASGSEVAAFLTALEDEPFWRVYAYPEVAELRAKRFSEFSIAEQTVLLARLQKRPPKRICAPKADTEKSKQARNYWAARELRRIQIQGGDLPEKTKAWLKPHLVTFPELARMQRFDFDFPVGVQCEFRQPRPDCTYDLLVGKRRLEALEAALSEQRMAWDRGPQEGASDWISSPHGLAATLSDLESDQDAGGDFSNVWERFLSRHSPEIKQDSDASARNLATECGRVVVLLHNLSAKILSKLIDPVSIWIYAWARQVVDCEQGIDAWLKIWPLTTAIEDVDHEITSSSDVHDLTGIRMLNTPVGRMVQVLFEACPPVHSGDAPLDSDPRLSRMRDAIEATSGAAEVNVKYRLIEHIEYFLTAAPEWTKRYLVAPLLAEDGDSLVLWPAVAYQTRFRDVLILVGSAMLRRVLDNRLHRESRKSLIRSLVLERLHAFRERRDPVVPNSEIQQVLRLLDEDEIRAHAAGMLHRFVWDISHPRDETDHSEPAEDLFQNAARPFLRETWPQERSLVSPAVSRGMAQLPAATGEAFVDAVACVERFLIPCDCSTMMDYGFYSRGGAGPQLSQINSPAKASALLKLLDLTIGTAEGSRVPYGLEEALAQIRDTEPTLQDEQAYRRLATATRHI